MREERPLVRFRSIIFKAMQYQTPCRDTQSMSGHSVNFVIYSLSFPLSKRTLILWENFTSEVLSGFIDIQVCSAASFPSPSCGPRRCSSSVAEENSGVGPIVHKLIYDARFEHRLLPNMFPPPHAAL